MKETSDQQRAEIESDDNRRRASTTAQEPQRADNPLSEREQQRGEGRQADHPS